LKGGNDLCKVVFSFTMFTLFSQI